MMSSAYAITRTGSLDIVKCCGSAYSVCGGALLVRPCMVFLI